MQKQLSAKRIVLGLSCLGFLGAGCFLLLSNEKPQTQRQPDIHPKAFVRPIGKDAKVKNTPLWQPLVRRESVVRGNSVMTDDQSATKLTLKDDQKFFVEPKTLISLSEGSNHQVVELVSGGLSLHLEEGNSTSLKHNNKIYEYSAVSSAALRFSENQAGDLTVYVLSGQVYSKSTDTEEAHLFQPHSEWQTSKLEPSSVTPKNIHLIIPQPLEEKWPGDENVTFKWEGSGASAMIEVATDREFTQNRVTMESSTGEASFTLPLGYVFFWRVVAEGQESVVSSFSLLELTPPLVNPFGELSVAVDNQGYKIGDVQFVWNDQLASDSYDFEIAEDSQFSKIIESRTTPETKIDIPKLKIGHYYWRVRSNAVNRKSLVSNVGELILKDKNELISLPLAQIQILKKPVAKNSFKKKSALTSPIKETIKDTVIERDVASLPPAVQESPAAVTMSESVLSEVSKNKYWVWAGTGANYQNLKQSIPSVEGQVDFSNVQGATMTLRGGFQRDAWGLDALYHNTPGEMKSSASTSVSNGQYSWRSISLEGTYQTMEAYQFRFGVQNHAMPFTILDTNDSTVDIALNEQTHATIGVDRAFSLSKNWRAEWLVRYQHQLNSRNNSNLSLSITPQYVLDGSVGGIYNLGSQTRLGIFWYGQMHEYQFKYGTNSLNSFSGNQSLMISNLEFRFGYEF